jgi:hypothetical protein
MVFTITITNSNRNIPTTIIIISRGNPHKTIIVSATINFKEAVKVAPITPLAETKAGRGSEEGVVLKMAKEEITRKKPATRCQTANSR